ncbi:hypothetical protein F0562_016015 [Nyssa sinensis]|uniref:Uncharacterized protein n=1 Tax=Nyssa sinensis TaxID=561372 RepID=A0A5J4ZN99_9ASTE|nr:hypothetical protein F0562_016015 [Nyssa sinensis]
MNRSRFGKSDRSHQMTNHDPESTTPEFVQKGERRRSLSKPLWVLSLLRCTTSTPQELAETSSNSLVEVTMTTLNSTESLRTS